MSKNYKLLTEQLQRRLDPDSRVHQKFILKEAQLSSISYADVLKYVRFAMTGVDAAYTQKSKEAGENVKKHLISGGIIDADFEYQGSVMTNTHIKGHSDIDLLVVSDQFYGWNQLEVNSLLNNPMTFIKYNTIQIGNLQEEIRKTPYQGDDLQNLAALRNRSENILFKKYSECDTTKPKSIKIKNKDLNREVDVVIANWFDDANSIIYNKGSNRGIQVYNKIENSRGKVDFPFLSIERINEKSTFTQGRLKKMIRFIKNIKFSSPYCNSINLNSFDFNAICYDIEVQKYQNLTFYELIPILYEQLIDLYANDTKANNLMSVDGREPIFKGKPEKKEALRYLIIETESILKDLTSSQIL